MRWRLGPTVTGTTLGVSAFTVLALGTPPAVAQTYSTQPTGAQPAPVVVPPPAPGQPGVIVNPPPGTIVLQPGQTVVIQSPAGPAPGYTAPAPGSVGGPRPEDDRNNNDLFDLPAKETQK